MKARMILYGAVALVFSACSTGSHVTTSHVDDIYFNPGDVPPPIATEAYRQQETAGKQQSADRLIISDIRQNPEGSRTMNNYIFDGQDAESYVDAQMYNMDKMNLMESDTTIYYDDREIKYVINNYFEGDDIDFGYRIRRFHRPYFHDPYYYDYWGWNSWYSPYSSLSWSWGMGYDYWGWGYSPWYSSWYSPYYSWYRPYYSWYSPYYSWYSPWGGYYGNPYYSPYWGNVRYIDSENYRYGKRRDFNTQAVYGSSGARRSGTSAISGGGMPLKSGQAGQEEAVSSDRRQRSISGVEGGGRPSREGLSGTGESGRILTEMRRNPVEGETTRSRSTGTSVTRSAEGSAGAPASRQAIAPQNNQEPASTTRRYTNPSQGQYARPAGTSNSSGQSTYTPSYNQQRSATRSNYNVQSYTRPATSVNQSSGTTTKSTATQSTYTRPSSSSSATNTYRSGSTYNRSSSGSVPAQSAPSSGSRSTYTAPSRSGTSSPAPSSGRSYSSPSRSSSSGSYSSGGGSYSGGSSSGGSSSGGSSSSPSRSGRR